MSLAAASLLGAAALTACAASGTKAADTGPDADLRFYEARCGVCHVPFHKRDFAPRQWPGILDVMAPKAGLSASQRDRMQRWLMTE